MSEITGKDVLTRGGAPSTGWRRGVLASRLCRCEPVLDMPASQTGWWWVAEEGVLAVEVLVEVFSVGEGM